MKDLWEALRKIQADLPQVVKSETADVRTEKRTYQYQYADLADVTQALLPRLAAVGLVWTCLPHLGDNQLILDYRLVHAESGAQLCGTYPLPSAGGPQQIGAAITYARRYCLCSVVGLAPDREDDDAASCPAPARRRRAVEKAAPGSTTPVVSPLRQRMFAQLREAGHGKKDDALGFCSSAIGRSVASTSDMSDDDVAVVLGKLAEEAGR